ncbi:MAG: putative rane protein [Pseudomonadota bacterium]|jgi:putative membrane protein
MHQQRTPILIAASIVLIAILALSGIRPYDRPTWLLEVLPVIIALPLLWFSYRRFPLTTLLYVCIFTHALVLILGGTYTYARVPLGFELAEILGLTRNPYDKIGHFFQGLVPALVAREILLRGAYVKRGAMLSFIVLCIVLAVSASYELIEWATALLFGDGSVDFLGTQGDPWDAQSDMLLALIGAIAALVLFSRMQDKQILNLNPSTKSPD